MNPLDPSWQQAPAIAKGDHVRLLNQVAEMRQTATIYPPQDQVLRALELVALTAVSVIILGQDPYHGEGQAHGLAFSVPELVKTPPSLRNIFKEIARDCYDGDTDRPMSSDLTRWAEQGVLLLNTVLTVEAGKAGSHQNIGWEPFTDDIIQTVNDTQTHCVFMLWGKQAQKKEVLLDPSKHLILTTSHPSPLGAYRGFNGCGHFSAANAYLKKHNRQPIRW